MELPAEVRKRFSKNSAASAAASLKRLVGTTQRYLEVEKFRGICRGLIEAS